ncbi:MAG: hypothetical protein Q4G26_15930 [Paracoccus sp. (in: a-proteobacteria)]|nr:hypothetical protein [Paracoccus sp. (in: a-proteobacteria)]
MTNKFEISEAEYEAQAAAVTVAVWEIWANKGLGLNDDDRYQTGQSATDAVANSYTLGISLADWQARAGSVDRQSLIVPLARPVTGRAFCCWRLHMLISHVLNAYEADRARIVSEPRHLIYTTRATRRHLGHLPAAAFMQEVADNFVRLRLAEGATNPTSRRDLTALMSALRLAARRDEIPPPAQNHAAT